MGTRPTSTGWSSQEILAIPSVGKSIGEKVEEFLRPGSMAGARGAPRTKIPPGCPGDDRDRRPRPEEGHGPVPGARDLGRGGAPARARRRAARRAEGVRRQDRGEHPARDPAAQPAERAGADLEPRWTSPRTSWSGSARARTSSGSSTRARCGGWPRRSATSTSSPRARTPEAVMEAFTGVRHRGARHRQGRQEDERDDPQGAPGRPPVVPLEAWGAAMIYFTGSKAHNIRIREMAVRKGLKLNEYGLFRRQVRNADRRRDRGGGLRAARPSVDPADASRGPRRGRGGARRRRCPTS